MVSKTMSQTKDCQPSSSSNQQRKQTSHGFQDNKTFKGFPDSQVVDNRGGKFKMFPRQWFPR